MDRDSDDDLENPRRELPSCSIAGCGLVAGAVVAGELLCAGHASEAVRSRRTAQGRTEHGVNGGNDIRT